MYIFRKIFLFFAIVLISMPAHALDIKDVRLGVHPDKLRIVIETAEEVEFKAFLLNEPERLSIDMPQFIWQAGQPDLPHNSGVKDLRHAAYQPGVSRIVFDLKGPHLIENAFTLPARESGYPRLVIDLSPTSAQRFSEQLEKTHGSFTYIAATNVAGAPQKPAQPSPFKPASKPLIVIDPGHGGQDPGAVAHNKIYEKDIVLALSKELKRALIKSGRYRVKLTRETDKYIRLRKRVKLSRDWGADMFLSIHADSINKPNVRGASVYTLSNTASDKQTAALARRENRADVIAGVDLTHEDQEIANILIDLAMRDTMNQSRYFANIVVDSFQKKRVNVLPNTHRYAGFAVLKAPDVPSVLIEAGFLSNAQEATLLNRHDYRRTIADAIARGIDSYFLRIAQNTAKN